VTPCSRKFGNRLAIAIGVLLASAGAAAAAGEFCAQPLSQGSAPTISDCLYIAGASVGAVPCEVCVCDADGSGEVRIGDALRCLRVVLGAPVTLACPPCSVTTTTLAECASCGEVLGGLADRGDLCELDELFYGDVIRCICSCDGCGPLCRHPVVPVVASATGADCLSCFRDTCRTELEFCAER